MEPCPIATAERERAVTTEELRCGELAHPQLPHLVRGERDHHAATARLQAQLEEVEAFERSEATGALSQLSHLDAVGKTEDADRPIELFTGRECADPTALITFKAQIDLSHGQISTAALQLAARGPS